MLRCETLYCLNGTRENRKLCEKCTKRLYRQRHPLKSAYQLLRANAQRRGIHFGISLVEWERFCAETGYMELKGIGALDMTIDRKDPRLGYIYSNMQILTNVENARKRFSDAKLKWTTSMEDLADDNFFTPDKHHVFDEIVQPLVIPAIPLPDSASISDDEVPF